MFIVARFLSHNFSSFSIAKGIFEKNQLHYSGNSSDLSAHDKGFYLISIKP